MEGIAWKGRGREGKGKERKGKEKRAGVKAKKVSYVIILSGVDILVPGEKRRRDEWFLHAIEAGLDYTIFPRGCCAPFLIAIAQLEFC